MKTARISIVALLLAACLAPCVARAETSTSEEVQGTYGKWSSNCGSNCSHEVGLDGLLARKLPNGCMSIYFEARGDQKDYRMFASGRLSKNGELVAYEKTTAFDGKGMSPKSCKVVFHFLGDTVEFDSTESDENEYCTASSAIAGEWLRDFRQKKSSNSVDIPSNAETIYRNGFWKRKTLEASLACSYH